MALGLDGGRGMVADRKASCQRTLGLCLEKRVGLITLGPRTCAVRPALEPWGQQQEALPLWLAKPGRSRQELPRRWHGRSVIRPVEVAYAAGPLAGEARRFLVVHSRQWAHPAALPSPAAQATEAARIAAHIPRVEARWCAGAADAEAAITDSAGRGQGRRGRTPRLWRSQALPSRVEAVPSPNKRRRRGRPPKAEASQVEVRDRLLGHPEACGPAEDAQGWTVLATTRRPAEGTDAERRQA